MIHVSVYRYHPGRDLHPGMDRFDVPEELRNRMVLDLLEYLHEKDPSLVYRRSCREGVCGSDGMNINGKNRLACITSVGEVLTGKRELTIKPLPGMPVIRDLVVDQSLFFEQYAKVRPWLINQEEPPPQERSQTPEQRARLDGLYEGILCGCCTSQCPSWWWNPEDYLGPAALLQAYRFIADSRDTGTDLRLSSMKDPFSLFRCRSIGNCTWVCPKGLNPMRAIGHIRREMLKKATQDV